MFLQAVGAAEYIERGNFMTTTELDQKLDSLIADFHFGLQNSILDNNDLPVTMSNLNEYADLTVNVLSKFRESIIEYLQSN